MGKKLNSLVLGLMLSASANAHDIADYNRINRETWTAGGVCRHALAAVVEEARRHGLETVIMRFEVEGRGTHALPVIKKDGYWYAFETARFGPDYFTSKYRRSRELRQDVGFYDHIVNDNRRLKKIIGKSSEARYQRAIRQWHKIRDGK